MRPIDSESWTLLVEAGRTCPGLPEEVRKALAVPYAELIPLPFIDGSMAKPQGVRCLPYWEEDSFDASYLEFLDDQIRREPRGPEEAQRLRVRRAALAPFVDMVLVYYRIPWDGFDATIAVEARVPRIVHVDVYGG